MQYGTFIAAANSFETRMLERHTILDMHVSLCEYARILRTPYPSDLFPLLLKRLETMQGDEGTLKRLKDLWRMFIIQYVSDNELKPLSDASTYEQCLDYLRSSVQALQPA